MRAAQPAGDVRRRRDRLSERKRSAPQIRRTRAERIVHQTFRIGRLTAVPILDRVGISSLLSPVGLSPGLGVAPLGLAAVVTEIWRRFHIDGERPAGPLA